VLDEPGDAAQRDLHRAGDDALDLFGREPGRAGEHQHLVVGDVGHGVEAQPEAHDQGERGEAQREPRHPAAVVDREVSDAANHQFAPSSIRSPSAATSTPSDSPSTTVSAPDDATTRTGTRVGVSP